MNKNPEGWPQHLHPYNNQHNHPVREIDGVQLYPYDTTKSRVNSWVVIVNSEYCGLITNYRSDKGYILMKNNSRDNPSYTTLKAAVKSISR